MDELRFVRRDDVALIVADDTGTEYRLVVDDTVLGELRHLSRRERDTSKVRPREIQALIRAGKSRAQVAQETGLDELDIERYAEPVLAERRYILELAHAVPVRTDADGDDDQRFGEVISERLVSLGTDTSEWSSWRDEDAGWMIGLEFISHDVAHQATWAFEHRKGTLSPITPDAVNLSKQGEVGDRLIPKLRVVDDGEPRGRFDSSAFDASRAASETVIVTDPTPGETEQTPVEPEPAAPEMSAAETRAEYDRRREIDQRAIKTNDQAPVDFSQTADLLDALRKRRGEREQSAREQSARAAEASSDATAGMHDEPHDDGNMRSSEAGRTERTVPETPSLHPVVDEAPKAARSIWSAAGVTGGHRGPKPADPAVNDSAVTDAQTPDAPPADATTEPGANAAGTAPSAPADAPSGAASSTTSPDTASPSQQPESERSGKKKRASIPSWDDILFGTRSDEDPA